MKKYGKFAFSLAAAFLLTAQPAFGAEPAGNVSAKAGWHKTAIVRTAQEIATVGLGPGETAAGAEKQAKETPAETGQQAENPLPETEQPAGNITPGSEQPTESITPGAEQPTENLTPETGQPAENITPKTEQPAESDVSETNVSSPVIEAGLSRQNNPENNTPSSAGENGQPEDSPQEDEEARQAEEARKAAEEAARQAAEEAARQAEEAQRAEEARKAAGRAIDPARPMVALTFDDGPQPSVGNRIMDCLAQYNGKATFFLVGERVPSYAAELQRMVAEGHEVANHSMNHKYLQKLGPAEIQAQVNQCNDIIEAACGVRPTIMRLPGGNHNATVRANTNMPMIQWNIDTLDWKTKNAQKTINSVLNSVKDGDIVLMHELYSQTGDATMYIIPELVNRGYQLVTVSEMAAAKGYSLEAGNLYSSFR